jgi:hypothetical protein
VEVKVEKKKNPIWDKVFADERLSGEIDKFLDKHLTLAIEHERRCIKMRLKQVEGYLDRISLMQQGMEYTETFKKIPSRKGVPFPRHEYERLLQESIKKQKVKK